MAPPLTSFWTPRIIATTVQGQWLGDPYEGRCSGVSIDSRAINPGQIFIAIKGDRFDGHDFVDAALQRGAAFAIVDRDTPARPALKVDDTLVALQQLASTYRDVLAEQGCKVIAVAGSNGKTTTRHLIHHVLTHAGLHGTQSPKSFNNHIGVPLTLLGASRGLSTSSCEAPDLPHDADAPRSGASPPEMTQPAAWKPDDFVVVEVGTNHPGEIAALGQIVRPDIAVITSIGAEHLEFFHDLAGVAKEEASLLAFVQPNGVVVAPSMLQLDRDVINADAYLLDPHLKDLRSDIRLVRFGNLDGGEMDVDSDPTEQYPQRFTVNGRVPVELPLLGMHNLANALAAICVAEACGVTIAAAAMALATASPPPMRMQCQKIGDDDEAIMIINDAYNANPDSMQQAVMTLGFWKNRSGLAGRVLVLGDMLELGDAGPVMHRRVLDLVSHFDPSVSCGGQPKQNAIRLVVLIGPQMADAAQVLRDRWPHKYVEVCPVWSDDLPQRIADMLQPGDVVLLKASRGMRLERLIPAIESRFGTIPADQG